jgi:hypothetical protein
MVGTTVTASSLGTASSVTMSNLNGTSTEPLSSGNSDSIAVNVSGRKKGSKKVNKKNVTKKIKEMLYQSALFNIRNMLTMSRKQER